MTDAINLQQGTHEWLTSRIGLVTASRVADIIAKTKSGPSASRANYLGQLVAERLTGQSAEDAYINADMQRGIDLEPHARFAYECRMGSIVQTCGLVLHPSMKAGASPDGLIGKDGLVEIKCPRTHVHIEYLEGGKPPSKYIPQMAWQCICTGRSWVDFASFDQKMPEGLQLFVVRYSPEINYLRALEEDVRAFIEEIDAKVEALSKLAA